MKLSLDLFAFAAQHDLPDDSLGSLQTMFEKTAADVMMSPEGLVRAALRDPKLGAYLARAIRAAYDLAQVHA